jgi:hypothetical protein
MTSVARLIEIEERENDNNYKDDNDEKQQISGGYNLSQLLNDTQTGGGITNSIFDDLQIPFGLYYNTNVVQDFYKVVKSSVIEDSMFDNLFDSISKSRSKPTRREMPITNKITSKHK